MKARQTALKIECRRTYCRISFSMKKFLRQSLCEPFYTFLKYCKAYK
nr:MAG TPA: hypothetical protein [Caudoviricetes sp.]